MIKRFFKFYAVKIIALIAVNCFLLTSVYGQALKSFIELPKADSKSAHIFFDFTFPFPYGKIAYSNFAASDTVIISIQDLHAHPQAQKNISKIIEAFDKEYGLTNVYLEGAYGQIDTSWLYSIEDAAARDALLNYMIDEGRLTGAEYYSAQSKRGLLIKGLEDKKDYLGNLKRFAEILEAQNEIEPLLNSLISDVEPLKEAYYNKNQKKLDELSKRRKGNKIDDKKYFQKLYEYADKFNIDAYKYENIERCRYLFELEKRLNFKKISKDLNLFVSQLIKILPYGQYMSIAQNTDNFSQTDKLCAYLTKISGDYGINLGKYYPNLAQIAQYSDVSRSINPIELISEEEKFLEEINETFYSDESAKEVAFLINFTRYLSDLLSSKITADDYRYYLANKTLFKTLWAKYVGNERLLELEKYETAADEFYKINERRNEHFLNNIEDLNKTQKILNASFDKSEEENAIASLAGAKKIYAVITGGFHTKALSDEFRKRGISNIVITPNVSDDAGLWKSGYHRIAKEQSKILFNALAVLPLSLNPEEIKATVLASAVKSVKDVNKILEKQISKAAGVKSAAIEEDENGSAILKLDTVLKRITYIYDGNAKEFIKPVYEPQKRKKEAKKLKSQNQNAGAEEISIFSPIEIIRRIFKKDGVNFQSKVDLLQQNRLTVSAATLSMPIEEIQTVIERLNAQSIDASALPENIKIPVKVIKSVAENELWLLQTKELLKARGIEPNIDNIIKLPQSSFSVRKVFDAVNIDEDALRWVEENVSPQTGNKSAILSQLVLFIGNNYAAANALISKGLKAALIQRVESRPKNYKKLSPLAPNVVVPVEYNGAIYEFKIEHYVPKDASIFEKTISIKAAVIGVSAQYKDGYDRLPTEVQTALKDKAYSMSHRYFASNIENNVKYMQHILGVSGTGAIFYDGGVPDESSSSESFLEIPNGKFGKYFDAQGLSIGVGNLLGEIAAVKERFKQKSIKAYKYARAIDLDKSKIALDKNKTEKFVASEIARNASAIRIKSKNAAAVVRALRRKSAPEVSAEISDDILKMENLLSSEGVKKILVLNLADVSEALLRDVYEIGFDGVYIEGVKSKDFENAIKLVGKISAIYPNASENFIETDAKTAITRKKNLKDAKIVPSIKISKNANAQTISAALENLDEAAVAINSIRVGDELAASQDVVSTAFLNNTAGVSKDASDVKNLKENRYLKIYYAALEIARKSDFVYGKLQNAGALAPYGAAENFEIQDFAGMKAALKAAGLSDDSPVLKYIEISQDGIGGYAAAKAYIQALIEKHYKLYETADTDSDSGKTVSKKKKSFLSSFSFIPLRVNAAKVYAGSDFFNSGADSSEDFALKIKDLRKNGVNNFEFQIKSLDSEIYVLLNGSLIPARQVLEIAAKNSKTKIIFNADELYQNASDDFTDFFNLISKYSAKISIMSSNADFIKRYGEKFPKTAFIFDIGYRTNADTLLSELNILPNLEAVALDARTYEILKELLHEKVNGVLLEIFIKTSPEDEYNDFISESKNSVNIISSKPVENFKKYKNALSAQGNIKILPFILLISSLDLFNSFWALYITSAGHPLSLVNLSIALCAPVYISSSFIAKYFSSKIGQRNTIIAFLFLQILGSSLLYFSGGSWIFVFLYLIMPIFAQGGVNTLFTPFMQSSLNAIDKLDKAEQVSAKSRSLVWIGIGVGILAGGALAAIIGQGGVIIASTALLSTMFVYVFKNSATLERAKQILESVRNKFNLKEKIKSAYLDLKEIFKNKKLFQIFISTTLLEILMTAVVPVEIQPLLTDIGFAVPAIAVIFFLASAIQSFVNNIASKGKILDIVKNEKPRNLYWAVLIGLMLIFVLTNNPIAFIAFFILIEVFQALSMTVESSYSAQNISEKRIELFYLFKLIFDATLSAVFSVVIAKAGGESSDASILGKIILGSTAVSFAIYFLAQIPYKIHNNSKKLKIFKKDVLNLNNADKILKAA